MEEKELMEKAKINPMLIAVGVVLIIISAVIGWYIGGNTDVSLEKEEVKTEEKENQIEEKVEGNSTYEVELFDEKNEYYNDISLKDKEAISGFVNVTNSFTDDVMRSNFLDNGYLIDDFKLVYVITNLLGGDGGVYYFSTSFLNSEIKKVFSTGIDSFDFMGGNYWLSAVGMSYVCNESICSVVTGGGGGTGSPYYDTKIVSTKKDGENTIYTLKEYYSDFETGIFVSDGGELLCNNDNCPEDIVGTYGDKLNTYEMTFDKDNRYVSSKKVN